ncbi:competence protein CoiA [Lactovum odontotermitis]
MLVALNENRKLINLLEEIPERRQKFFCPACKSEVRLKCGLIKIPHFAHVSLQNCQSWSENESAQHLALKKAIFAWASQSVKTEIEKYLPELEQTPDLLMSDQIAIEVQCSRLSVKRLRERTLNYHSHGYQVLWLAGQDLWLGETMSPLQKNLLYFSENRGFHYWELDLERSCLRLKYLIYQNLRGQLSFLTEEFHFGSGDFLEILRKPFSAQKMQSLTVENDDSVHVFVQRSLFHRVPHWMAMQETYYLAGKNLLDEKFERQWAPPGLNILTGEVSTADFCQISQDLSIYYQNFLKHPQTPLKNKGHELYPPRFYAIILYGLC